MYILNKISPDFDAVNAKSKELVNRISDSINLKKETLWVPVNQAISFSKDDGPVEKLYIIKQGILQCCKGTQLLFFLEAGDLIGFGSHFFQSGVRFIADVPVIADEYQRSSFMEALGKDQTLQGIWNDYLAFQLDLYAHYLSSLVLQESPPRPDVLSFSAGDVIIDQGSQGREVYSLIDGHAEVYVDNVKVGVIYMDEIFGAIAALTDTPRTAKVTAATNCLVQVLPRENFIQLMATRPKTILKMVEDMARVIVSLNHKVVELQKVFSQSVAEKIT